MMDEKKGSKARTAAENAWWADGKLAASWADFDERFGDELSCEEHLLSLKYPNGFECPRCGGRELRKVGGGRREWRCAGCGKQLSATVGTALEGTKLPLTKWFRAIRMVTMDTRGASAQAVARECGVSDATGTSMLRRIRTAMGTSMAICKVGGEWVEVDGAHVACGNYDGSGVRRPGSGMTDAPVLVAVSDSRCAIRACSDSNGSTMDEFASAHVSRQSEVRCDDHGANIALACGWGATVRASAADGDSEASLPAVHHVISNFKAWLAGTFHGVSVGRLQEYCDEFSWRYCHRAGDAFADLLSDLARWPHVALSEIRSCRVTMPAHEPPVESGHEHNRKILAKWRAEDDKAKVPLAGRMASLLSRHADDCEPAQSCERPDEPAPRELPDEVPRELLSMLDSSLEVVSNMMHDEGLVA